MPIKKRKLTSLSDEAVWEAVDAAMNQLAGILGNDITVSVVVQRGDAANIITNESDPEQLTKVLQSIIAHRKHLKKIA